MRARQPICVTIAALIAGPAFAQPEPDLDPAADPSPDPSVNPIGPPEQEPVPDLFFTARLFTGAQLDTDIDGGGEYSFWRALARVSANKKLAEGVRLDAAFTYQRDDFDFSGSTGIAGLNPWDVIDAYSLRTFVFYQHDDHWNFYGGPAFTWSAEDGAGFNDAFTVTGIAGASYAVDKDHIIGLGVGVADQLEDDPTAFPIVYLDWKLDDTFTLRNSSYDLGRAGVGLELAAEPIEHWEFALGSQYDTNRFRLDDTGPAPGGIGDVSSVPIYFSVKYQPIREFHVRAFVGVSVFGQVLLETSSGARIGKEDADPAPVIGIRAQFSF